LHFILTKTKNFIFPIRLLDGLHRRDHFVELNQLMLPLLPPITESDSPGAELAWDEVRCLRLPYCCVLRQLEEEIDKMLSMDGGLRRKDHVLELNRLMLRAESVEHRLSLLKIIQVVLTCVLTTAAIFTPWFCHFFVVCGRSLTVLGRLTAQVDWLDLRVGGHPALSLHSPNEPCELPQ